MKFRPLHDRVVVKRIDAGDKTAGGITFPTPPRKSPRRAKSSPSARAAATKPAS
jgi:co-chaperonin GroES (HSP10)